MNTIKAGMRGQSQRIVMEEWLASYMGSGNLDVFATPAMIALMEAAAVNAIKPFLPDGKTSVGAAIDVKHLAPTPPGARVRAEAEVIEIEGARIRFSIKAWDEKQLIGEGARERYVVDTERFLERRNQ